jgi:hypothetical protein
MIPQRPLIEFKIPVYLARHLPGIRPAGKQAVGEAGLIIPEWKAWSVNRTSALGQSRDAASYQQQYQTNRFHGVA